MNLSSVVVIHLIDYYLEQKNQTKCHVIHIHNGVLMLEKLGSFPKFYDS